MGTLLCTVDSGGHRNRATDAQWTQWVMKTWVHNVQWVMETGIATDVQWTLWVIKKHGTYVQWIRGS